ncbi:hypothetical protein [Novosphingobium sp. MBES04]|uniref:hypothetical protein n=1 Tax=Novosphingobium sp. MBES04 TaxID=1206458 RepID=UPI00057ED752|nr:hypothetical protein [Novosphingobium sp. MBES04]GAM04328.1 hypothetical conserved protein [Novosphingobium sp. MBES04]
MARYVTLHLHNIAAGREADYAAWFEEEHRPRLTGLEGFLSADRFEIAPIQIMPDIDQPWRFLSFYEFDYQVPDRDIPKLGRLLEGPRCAGLIDDGNESERLYTYNMYSDWHVGPNWQQGKPLSGLFIIPANLVQGREEDYHRWYDEVHIPEVSRVPGFVGMKRGRLAGTQCNPRRYCPGGELVVCAHQTDNLLFSVKDFSARARGVSPSGVAMEPRSTAGSFARTVHFFTKISGEIWDGGIAYAGDFSAYPENWERQPRQEA